MSLDNIPKGILFFADRLPPLTGGVEMHGRYFIEHFTNHPRFPLAGVISKAGVNLGGYNPAFVFFNSGFWIEELDQIREMFPKAQFIYRTGGNEILKASLIQNQNLNHSARQNYWVQKINQTMDIMITNSFFTERRLLDIGINIPFVRCVGGVNTSLLKPFKSDGSITIFCAARFVPYKNHSLLISVIRELISRGFKLKVRLAGDGPLMQQVKEQVIRENLSPVVTFLGVLDNEDVCCEMARATIYFQLSADQVTEVLGGSYIHSEGMGRSILEAITAGTFVVAGKSGALSEIVTEDRGRLVDLDSIEKIADTIEQVIQHRPKRGAYRDCFSWENIFKRYEQLFEGVNENIASH